MADPNFTAIQNAVNQAAADYMSERDAWENEEAEMGAEIRSLQARVTELQDELAALTPQPTPAPTVHPVSVANGQEVVIGGNRFRAQSSNKPYALAIDQDPAPTYGRMELRQGDKWVDNPSGQRIEMRDLAYLPFGQDIWISEAFRWSGELPTGNYHIISQLNQGPDAEDRTPRHAAVLSVYLDPSGLAIATRGDTAKASLVDPGNTTRYRGPVPSEGDWHFIVIHTRLSRAYPNGMLEAWVDGQRVLTATNIVNAYYDQKGPYFKFGTYRDGAPETTVVEFANVERTVGTPLADRIANPLPPPVVG